MPLTPTDEPGVRDFFDVRFAMYDGTKRVICTVTGDAIEDIEQCNPSQEERVPIFERHRSRFEQIASDLYDAGYQPRVITKHLSQSKA